MPGFHEQSEEEIHEGTEALQALAADVEAEREHSASAMSLPHDDPDAEQPGDGAAGEDHDDHDPVDPGDIVPPAVFPPR
ncbi:hypothetical protein [Demequina sp.]|uniref:hypothetical protein n=1 Tax=Demequina sp. TaxID=2050685 RepID=UPI003A89DFD7